MHQTDFQGQHFKTIVDNVAEINRITSHALCQVKSEVRNMSSHQIETLSSTLKMEMYPLAAKKVLVPEETVEDFVQHFSDVDYSDPEREMEVRVKATYLAVHSHKIADNDKRKTLLGKLSDGSGGYNERDFEEMAAVGRILSGKYSGTHESESQRFGHAMAYLSERIEGTRDAQSSEEDITALSSEEDITAQSSEEDNTSQSSEKDNTNPSLNISPSLSRRVNLILTIHSELVTRNSSDRVKEVMNFCQKVERSSESRNEATLQFYTISMLLYEFLSPWEYNHTFLNM